MIEKWERRRILIWGKTRPELSTKYREIVCTGGVFADTGRLARIYPVPLRYMDDSKIFAKYQWITASISRSSSDLRPESYKIQYDNVEVGETIQTKAGNWDERAKWIMRPENIFQSVEHLKERQSQDNTSLGLVKPAEVLGVIKERYSQPERNAFWKNYQERLEQMALPLDIETSRPIKPLAPPDYRFKIRFRCDDERCSGTHTFGVLDWELDALYFNLKKRGDEPEVAAEKVVTRLRDEVCAADKDTHFYLGNIHNHPQVFTIVGLWWPKLKKGQVTTQTRLI